MAVIRVVYKDGDKQSFPTPAALVDALGQYRADRLAADKVVAALKERESALCDWVIENLPKSSATGLAGKTTAARIETETVPTAEDWPQIYAYVAKHKAWEMLQRRLSVDAVRERWGAGKVVPGVGKFTKLKVMLTAVRGTK